MSTNQPLTVTDFTRSLIPIFDILNEFQDRSPGGKSIVYISDVVDKLGNQYVDLVQEGGGVHGIALAGYTYVLEKMGVSFMKMAGTSAGSINTLLLSGVSTRDEMAAMQSCLQEHNVNTKGWKDELRYDPNDLDAESYYETRSEKLVEYLAGKDLRDLVDGHPKWKTLLLELFQGAVDFKLVKKYVRQLSKWSLVWLLSMILLVVFAAILSIGAIRMWAPSWLQWTTAVTAIILGGAFIWLVGQGLWMRLMYRLCARFGVNHGTDFEAWVARLLAQNGVHTVSHLKSKLQLERECLQPQYVPRVRRMNYTEAGSVADAWYRQLAEVEAEVKAVGALTVTNKAEYANCGQAVALVSFRLLQLARALPTETTDREIRADQLLELYYPMILKQNWLNEHCEFDGEEIKTSYDKEIALVCSDITNGIKVEFPAMHKMYWGENFTISPASYVRGSMSVPFFFKPFEIKYVPTQRLAMEEEWRNLLNIDMRIEQDNKSALLVDGGLLSNFPVNIFYNADFPVPSKPTIGVKLEFEDDARSTVIKNLPTFIGSLVNTMRYFYDRDFISRHAIFKKTVRSIDTGKVHWLNFALTEDDQIELFYRGALTAAIFLLSSTPQKEEASAKDRLVRTGNAVEYKGKVLNIYKNMDGEYFQSEDFSVGNMSFNWEQYKKDRLLHLSESALRTTRLKRKASFGKAPDKKEDKNPSLGQPNEDVAECKHDDCQSGRIAG